MRASAIRKTEISDAVKLLSEFLAVSRQKRRRGKLAPYSQEIAELRRDGASFSEIADYLRTTHSITVTRSSILRHMKRCPADQPVRLDAVASSKTSAPEPLPKRPSYGSQQTPDRASSHADIQRESLVRSFVESPEPHPGNVGARSNTSEAPPLPELQSPKATPPSPPSLRSGCGDQESAPPVSLDAVGVVRREEPAGDKLITRYKFGSPEHKALMAEFRAEKKQSNT